MATLEIGRRRDRRRPALTTPTRSVWDRAASLAAMTRNMPHRSDYKLWNQSRAMTVWDAASFRPPHEFLIQFSNSKNFQTAKMFKSKTALRTPNLQTRVRASRRDAPESLKEDLTPREGLVRPRGRAGCRVPDAPAALCAKRGSTSAHKSSQRRHRKTRQSRTQWCYSLCRALLGEVLYCARPPTEDGLSGPVGPTNLRRNCPSIRGGTTRFTSPLQYRSSCAIFHQLTGSQLHVHPALQNQITPDTAASIASHPASVTIAKRPSCGTRRKGL